VSDLDRAAVLDALDAVYQKVTAAVSGLGEADMMRPSRCAGWAVNNGLDKRRIWASRDGVILSGWTAAELSTDIKREPADDLTREEEASP